MFEHLDRLVSSFESGKITRRELVASLGAFAAAMTGLPHIAGADDKKTAPTFQTTELNHIALRVTDIPKSRDWYVKHLGLTVSRDGSPCFLTVGNHFLALFHSQKAGLDHYCYTIDDYEPGPVVKRLDAAGLKPERHGDRVYFPDPDGLTVQLAGRNR